MEWDALTIALLQEAFSNVTIHSGTVLMTGKVKEGRLVGWELEQKAQGTLDDLRRKQKPSTVD